MELSIIRLGRSPLAGSYSPALMDMEVCLFTIQEQLFFAFNVSIMYPLGFINQFLSWKLFLPISRLSYAAYLIHYNMIKAYASHLRKPFYFTECVYATTYFGILVITFAIAFVLSVVVEMPFLNLDKFFFPIKSKTRQGIKHRLCTHLLAQRMFLKYIPKTIFFL